MLDSLIQKMNIKDFLISKHGVYYSSTYGGLPNLSDFSYNKTNFIETYRKTFNPRLHTQLNPTINLSELNIKYRFNNIFEVFTSSHFSSMHALNSAFIDIKAGKVEQALVFSVFDCENKQFFEKHLRNKEKYHLSEGVVGLIFQKEDLPFIEKYKFKRFDNKIYYGSADYLMNLCLEVNSEIKQ